MIANEGGITAKITLLGLPIVSNNKTMIPKLPEHFKNNETVNINTFSFVNFMINGQEGIWVLKKKKEEEYKYNVTFFFT